MNRPGRVGEDAPPPGVGILAGVSLLDAPVIAHVVRNDVVESVHHGLGVITAPDGSVLDAVGDPATPVFARSSNKPLQALAMLRAGLDLPSRHLALACASHSGEQDHRAGVKEMLSAAGLAETDLRNTPDFPLSEDARVAWITDGHTKMSITQNCSGKHAAMLTTCVRNGWDLEGYLHPDHPLQQRIGEVIADEQGVDVVSVAVDGCGAPAHMLPLEGLARSFGRLAGAPAGDRRRVAQAMRESPFLLGGTGREATELMQRLTGAIAKDGAEGVFAVGLSSGHGVAVKVADGNPRASRVLLAELLSRIEGVPSTSLDHLRDAVVLGHGEPVGRVVFSEEGALTR